MLVLSRRVGERVYIGNDITLEILSINRGIIRLGISAPAEVSIDRQEVREARMEQEDLKQTGTMPVNGENIKQQPDPLEGSSSPDKGQ